AGYSDVSKATQDRVKAAAQSMGYRPNASARNLKLGKANAMGLVMPAMGPGGDPFLSELIGSIGAALAERDLDLVIAGAPDDEAALAAIRRLADGRKVDGVIVPRTRWHDARVDLLIDLNLPFVCHGRTSRADEHAWLDIDGEAAFEEATRRLVALGHRRIALINAPVAYTYARHREAGFRKAMAEAGLDPAAVVSAPHARIQEGEMAATVLLDDPTPPTALLCATDQLAIGALAAIRKRGLKAGAEVSVVGYDDISIAAHTDPPLTTMRQSIAGEGTELVRLLLGRIAGQPVAQLQTLWRATLVARDSDGPARA
ncbi:MAG: substrate-binding domain-containing protein, partial [Beijerinckiaceae bacterium]